MRHRRLHVLTIAAACAIGVGVFAPVPVANSATQGADEVGPQGIVIVPEGHDQVVPEGFRDVYAALDALTEIYPTDFGYVSPNITGTPVEIPVLTQTGRSVLAEMVAGRVPEVPALAGDAKDALVKRNQWMTQATRFTKGLSVRAISHGRSRAELDQVKDDVIEWSRNPAYRDADIWQTSVERDTGRVVVSVAALTPALARHLVASYGTDVAVEIAANRHAELQVGRLADNSPFWGGARISVPPGSCSDAFSWRISSTPAMVTAGHCVPSGGAVASVTSSMGTVTSGTRENWNSGVGTVTVSGYSGYHGDGAIIQVYSGKSSSATIYRGAYNSSSSSTVLGMWSRRAQSGDQYCTGGSYSGEICGWTVDKTGVNVSYTTGEIARNMVTSKNKQGWCMRSGDSGGSVFTSTSSGVYAKGVHSGAVGGGSDSYGGLLDQCHEIFTDIWDIYYGLPGSLA